MKTLSILSLLFAVLFIQSCKEDPSAPVKEPYVPPVLIATNTPSVKYPNDVFPLSEGNFWIYRMYIRDTTFKGWEEVAKFISTERLDTVFVVPGSGAMKKWRYINSESSTGTSIEYLNTYKITSGFWDYFNKNTNYDPDNNDTSIMSVFGNRMARLDSTRLIAGMGCEDNPAYPYIDDESSLWDWRKIKSPERTSEHLENYLTINSNIQTFNNCILYHDLKLAKCISVKKGIGPVAYALKRRIVYNTISRVDVLYVLHSYHVE